MTILGRLPTPWDKKRDSQFGAASVIYPSTRFGTQADQDTFDEFTGLWSSSPARGTPPTLVGTSSAASVGNNVTITVPAGTSNGNLMLLFACTQGSNSVTTPSGWTLELAVTGGGAGNSTIYMFSRTASSEPANYVVVNSGSAWAASMAVFSNHGGLGNFAGNFNVVTSNFDITQVSMSLDSFAVTAFCFDNPSFTRKPDGVTQQQYVDNPTTGRNATWLGTQGPLTAGTYGSKRASSGGAPSWAGINVEIKAAASGSYSLVAGAGSFSLAGQVVGLLYSRVMAADLGTTSLTGQDVTLTKGYPMAVGTGSFSLSGQDVGTVATRIMAAVNGNFTLGGQDVGLLFARLLSIGTGSLTETGQDVALLVSRLIAAANGTASLSGQDVALVMSRVLAASVGSTALSGQAVNLLYGRVIAAATGSYTLTGQDVALLVSALSAITVGIGNFAANGQDVALKVSRVLTADQGSMTLTGRDVGLLYGRLVAASAGTYALTGQDVALLTAHILSIGAGSVAESGQDVALKVSRVLAASSGSITLTGRDVALLMSRLIAASQGSYILTGRDVELLAQIVYTGPVVYYATSSVARAVEVAAKPVSRAVALNTSMSYSHAEPQGTATEAVIINTGQTTAEFIDHV